MTATNMAITIWWKAIVINAVLIGIGSIFHTGFGFLVVFILVLVGGFIVTIPLLPFITLLVKIHTLIPYSNEARIAWLRCMLVLLVWIIFGGGTLLTETNLFSGDPVGLLACLATSIAVLSSCAFNKKIIMQLHTHPEPKSINTIPYV